MKANVMCLIVLGLLFVSSCGNDSSVANGDMIFDDVLPTKSEDLDDEDLSLDFTIFYTTIFSEANAGKSIFMRFDCDEDSGGRILTARFEPKGSFLPDIKTRSEDDSSWTFYGEVCTKLEALKFYNFLEKKFKDAPYEVRVEPVGDCKKVFYREGQSS